MYGYRIGVSKRRGSPTIELQGCVHQVELCYKLASKVLLAR